MVERRDLVHRNGSTYSRRARATALDRGEHGTLACYRSGCRCCSCTSAQRDYYRQWYGARQIDTQGAANRRVPIGPAAVRLVELRARGWGWPKLAAEIGCSISTLARIVREHELGTRARCWSTFERAVLSIDTTAPIPKRAPATRRARVPRPIELRPDELAGLAARGYGGLFPRS